MLKIIIELKKKFTDAARKIAIVLIFLLCTCIVYSTMKQKSEGSIQWVDGELYYFDENGNIDLTEKWIKLDDSWYYIGSHGYAKRNKWQGMYYLLDNGKMAVDQYVDRFYVDENGKWEYNNWDSDHWLINGKWIADAGTWYFEEDNGIRQKIDFKNIRSINRLGYNTIADDGMPQQSIIAYEAAIEHGFKILLCDLRFSSDDKPICFHDKYINQKARNTDGSEIVAIEGGVSIADSTLEELEQYDFGIYRGYPGIKILTFDEMLSFCQEKNVEEIYIEIKEGTGKQIQNAVKHANEFGITLSWAASTYEQAKAVIGADPYARISLMPDVIDDEIMDKLLGLKTGFNEVFIFAYGNTILNSEIVYRLQKNDIMFEMGTINSEEEVVNYLNGAYHYCSGIESDVVVVNKIDVDTVLRERGY